MGKETNDHRIGESGRHSLCGSAYAEFTEDRKGIIKEDYLGGVVIFDNDLMTMPYDKIMTSKVDYTIIGEEVVYKRDGAN
ncbi:MAG: amidohydrolase family protein [Phycisphaerales bacterium]|nr:MAG: amidohydrolase family protein [Phycisphaerales bacterium]